MDDNLVSVKKTQDDIKAMKLLALFLKTDQGEQLWDLESQLDNMISQTAAFNERFSPYGWCAYDRMNFDVIKSANDAFEKSGIKAAEQVLINYYTNDVSKIIYRITNSSDAFSVRNNLINQFFEDHFAGRYYASVPLALIIVDGAVNDFTKSKGFFAEGTSVDAWDCLVGCSDGLSKLKVIFNQNRTKTNTERITLPYRNGILHGRDLNYANEYVSCKCVALMFAIADWMTMKNSEQARKEEYEKSLNLPPIKESILRSEESKKISEEISSWRKKSVTVGKDIPASGKAEDYTEYPYLVKIVEMLDAWKSRNYGKLSIYLQRMFPANLSAGKRAGECRKIFENKILNCFEIIEVEEQYFDLSKVIVRVSFTTHKKPQNATLTFGCKYKNNSGGIGAPWRNNGDWVLIPWNTQDLYH